MDNQYKAIANWEETKERERIKMFNPLSENIKIINYLPLNEDFKKSTGRTFSENENMFTTSLNGMVNNHSRQLLKFQQLNDDVDALIRLIENEIF